MGEGTININLQHGVGMDGSSVAKPEPQGAKTFGWSRSWRRYLKFWLWLPVPAPGQTKVVCLIIIHLENTKQRKSVNRICSKKNRENSTFSFRTV